MGESRGADQDRSCTTGRIKALYRKAERKQPSVREQQLVLIEGVGIQGDVHADGGEKQLLLLTSAEKAWMEEQETKGFCFKKLKENIELEGDLFLHPGDVLSCGETELLVVDERKECYPELCRMAEKKSTCILRGKYFFAKVISSGKIKEGMIWTLKKRG